MERPRSALSAGSKERGIGDKGKEQRKRKRKRERSSFFQQFFLEEWWKKVWEVLLLSKNYNILYFTEKLVQI